MNSLLPQSLVLLSLPALLHAQTYRVGDTVENHTFTDYHSGESTSIHELGAEGGILVLEWFAWWCPFCASAAANVETGIVEHYAMNNGNPHGLPVRHVALNVQGGARSQSDTFINRYGIETVVEDYDRALFSLFSLEGGQPFFVVINAEANSPSADQWEVLYTRLNYAGNSAPDISALMRPVIDAVEPGTPADPVITFFPGISPPTNGWYQSDWFGWFYGTSFPLVNHLDFGYCYLAAAPGVDTLYFYHLSLDWLFTGATFYPYLYSHRTGDWLLYQIGSMGEWFYDYHSMEWRTNRDFGS